MPAINEREFFPSSTVNVDVNAPSQQIQQAPIVNPRVAPESIDNQLSVNSIDKSMQDFISAPSSLETKSAPQTFDWDKGERYRDSKNYQEFGYDPNAAPVSINGKIVDANEARYAAAQTTSEKFGNAVVGGSKLFADTFIRQGESWWDIAKGIGALASGVGTGHAWAAAQAAYMGTGEELMQMNKEQQEIMNKYAIFQGAGDDTIFSGSFLANSIQQFGLGAGQTVEMLAEVGLTWGAGLAIDAIRLPALAAKLAEGTELLKKANSAVEIARASGNVTELAKAEEALKTAQSSIQGNINTASQNKALSFKGGLKGMTGLSQEEQLKQLTGVFNELQKTSDISNIKPLVSDMWKSMTGIANIIPGSGVGELVSDLYKAGKGVTGLGVNSLEDAGNFFKNIGTGAQNWGAWKGGVGSLARDLSMFNMASTHGKLLAFTTYGAQYGDLITQYEKTHDGQAPDGSELEAIKNNAWMAARDVFELNVPLIMLMGKIEWGGLFSKFSTSARAMRGLAPEIEEGGESALMAVKGKWVAGATHGGELGVIEAEKIGQEGIKEYERATKMFPAIRTINTVRKDFGLGTALWQGAKVWGPSQLHKFELAEGLHLLLQTVSDTHFRDYYKKLYDGGTDIHGVSIWDSTNTGTWAKEMLEGFNNHQAGQGFQTFIMGATGGMFMTPIHTLLASGREKIMSKFSGDYKNAVEQRKEIIKQNLDMMNTFFKDPKNILKTHVDAIKACGLATGNMGEGSQTGNKYEFKNAQGDLFAKTVSTFIKNGQYESFLYTMNNMAKMDAKSFYEACPNMKPSSQIEETDMSKLPAPAVVVGEITKGISEYYNRVQSLKDEYSGLVTPEYYEGRGSKMLKMSEDKRAAEHTKLTEEYKDIKTGEEHVKLSAEEQIKNRQRYEELQSKRDKVEEQFHQETTNNQYHQALMQKRALDEAIECMASLDHNAKEAIKRKLSIEGDMINPNEVGNGIAKHGSRVINTLGDKLAVVKEIANLKKQLQVLKPIEGQSELPDTKTQRESYEKQLEHLQNWQRTYNIEEAHQKLSGIDKYEEKLSVIADFTKGTERETSPLPNRVDNIKELRKAHDGYINALNSEALQTPEPISQGNYDKSLSLLTEHINLTKDYHDYIKALNIISDPHGFQSLHDRIWDGMDYAMFDRYLIEKHNIEAFDDMIDKAKAQAEERTAERQKQKEEDDRKTVDLQKLTLSNLLSTVESDIKKQEEEREKISKEIADTESKLPTLEEDLNVAKELLKQDTSTSKSRKEFRKLEQSLRGKVNYLKGTIQRLTESKKLIDNALESLNALKENYSKAIKEIEDSNKPFDVNQETQEHLEQVVKMRDDSHGPKSRFMIDSNDQYYKLDYAIQETQQELDELDNRIGYYQKVVDTSEKALNDILNLINFTDEDGAVKRPYEVQVQQLAERFESYSKDLQDAKEYRAQVKDYWYQLKDLKNLDTRVQDISNTLKYIDSIKTALETKIASGEKEPVSEKKKVKKESTEKQEKEKKERDEKTVKEIVDNAVSGTEMSQETKEDIAANSDLQKVADDIKKKVEEVTNSGYPNETPLLIQEKIEEIKKESEKKVKHIIDDNVEIYKPELQGVPTIIEDNKNPGKWKIDGLKNIKAQDGTDFRKFDLTKREANEELKRYINDQSKKGGLYEKIEGTEFRKGQTIYDNKGNPFTITSGINDKGYIELHESTDGKRVKLKADVVSLNKLYSATKEQKEPISAQQQAEENRENPILYDIDGKVTTDSPMKINYNDIFSFNFDKSNGEGNEEGAKKFSKFLLENNIRDLNGNDVELLLTVLKNNNFDKGPYYNPTKNPDIRVKKVPLTYALNVKKGNKIESLYLMTNGANYEFQVSPDNWVPAEQLTPEQFYEFFNMPTSFFTKEEGLRMSEQYREFKEDVNKTKALDSLLSSKKVADTLTHAEIHDIIDLHTKSELNYSGANKFDDKINPESSLHEVLKGITTPQQIVLPDGTRSSSIIINNGLDAIDHPFIVWGDGYKVDEDTGEVEVSLAVSSVYQETKHLQSKYTGMYSLLHQLPTGEIIWVQLSPSDMPIGEVENKISQINKLISEKNGDILTYVKDVEGGSKTINDILKDIFIVTNPYENKKGRTNPDLDKKWSIRPTVTQYREGNKAGKPVGEWHMDLHIEQSYGLPSERIEYHLTLDKPVFTSAQDFVDSINKVLHEKGEDTRSDNFGKPLHLVSNLNITTDNFRNQVHRGDIKSIMNMSTNLTVENGSVINKTGIIWSFKGESKQVLENATPGINKQVARGKKVIYTEVALNKLKDKILSTENLIPIMHDIFKVLDEAEYKEWQSNISKDVIDIVTAKSADAESEEEEVNIVNKYLLPLFIDKKINEYKSTVEQKAIALTPIEKALLVENDNVFKDDKWYDDKGNVITDVQQTLNILKGETTEPDDQQLEKKESLQQPTNNPLVETESDDFDEILKESEKERNRPVNKIVPSDTHFDAVSLQNINEFEEFCKNNLPMMTAENPDGIISVEDLGVLVNNLKEGNVSIGSFTSYMQGINQKGRISIYKNSPAKYHEAFHAIFRLLLTQDRIDDLLRIAARENPATEAKLAEFRKRGYNYPESEIKQRFYEEYMADKFEAWKQNHKTDTSHVLKSFFRKIVDFFKELWAKLSGSKIEGLFYEINRGVYKNARLQENMFTGEEGIAITQPALKNVWVGTQEIDGRVVNRFLPQQEADQLSASIASLFLQHLDSDLEYQKTGKYDKNAILDSILDKYESTLNITDSKRKEFFNKQADKNFSDPEAKKYWKRQLVDRYQVFRKENSDGSINESRRTMKESVDQYLKIMGLKQKLEADKLEADEQEHGSLTTEKLERDSAFSLGGYGSLPEQIRKLIGTVTYTLEEKGSHDGFFNTTFLDGTHMVQAVDANKVYNGMLKCLANTSDVTTIMQKMMRFIDDNGNPETTKFITYLLNKTNSLNNIEAIKKGDFTFSTNGNLIQQVVKAFNQYFVNTKHIGVEGASMIISDANTRDASFYQISNWQNNFNEVFYNKYLNNSSKTFVQDAIKSLRSLRSIMHDNGTAITDTLLKSISKALSTTIESKLGINIHPSYVQYSILKSKLKPEGEVQVLTQDQQDFVNSYPLISEIQLGPLDNLITQLEGTDKNIFAKDEGGIKTSYQTLKYWADGNMMFDENINLMSHTNAAGENVTNFVQPFYSGVQVSDMNKGINGWMKDLPKEFMEEVKNNPLLKDVNFQYLMNKGMLSVEFIDGMRLEQNQEETEDKYIEAEIDEQGKTITAGHYDNTGSKKRMNKEKEGRTYSDFSDKDFLASLLAMYNVSGQNDCRVFKGQGDSFYRVLVPIRVPAEKSMFALIKLPVIHTILENTKTKENKLSDNAFDILYNRIEEEFNKIRSVHEQLEKGNISGHNTIENWNTGKLKGEHLFMTNEWVGDLKSDIENGAKTKEFSLETIKEQLRNQLNSYFLGEKGQVQQMIDRMIKEGMLSEDLESLDNSIPVFLFDGLNKEEENDALHIKEGNFKSNLSQVYMNAFLNTTMVNNLLHGDESKLYKDMLDVIKRESGTMAVGNSIEGVTTAKEMGITKALKEYHHLTYEDEEVTRTLPGSDKKLEVGDGFGRCTAKGYRYMLFGKGTLNAVQARLLDKIEIGTPISEKEFFGAGGLKENGAFTSLKMVHNDGQVYLKFSVSPLFTSFTSYKENGKWKALPGKEKLHALRERMEAFEDGINDDGSTRNTIVIAHPVSASKMLTRNVFKGSDFSNVKDSHFESLQAKFFKEQLQNPSNKTQIADPTQPKLQLPAEQDMEANTIYNGVSMKVGDVAKIYMDSIAQRISNNFTTARDSLFKIEDVTKDVKESIDSGKVTPQLAKFLTMAKENLEATGTDAQMLEFMDLDKNGQPKYNINFPSLLPKITSIFFSYFSKGVLRETVPGHALAIVSPEHGAGLQIKEVKSIWSQEDIDQYKVDQKLLYQPKEWTVITQKEFKNSPSKYNNLRKFNNKDSRIFSGLKEALESKEAIYILDDMRDNYLKFKDGKPIGRFTEAMMPAHYAEQMANGFTDEDKFSFGTRIPYVDKNSATSFEFVDQLPVEMGSVIMTAREYYERTGADNDIDKDYVSVADTYVNSDGERVQYGSAKTDSDKLDEFVNYMIKNNKDVKGNLKNLMATDPEVKEIKDSLNKLSKVQKELAEQFLDNKWFMEESSFEGDNKLFKQAGREIKVAQKEASDSIKELNNKISDIKRKLSYKALEEAKLPHTVEKFIQAGGENLNTGVLNNRTLAAKIAMLNHEGMVDKQNVPTSTQPLIDVVNSLKEEFKDCKEGFGKQVYEMLTEKNVDVNSILGMVNDRSATMMGADSIGAVATTNIVYSFLNHMQKELTKHAITIDGHTFNSFKEGYAWDATTKSYKENPLTRVFAALTCLTNTMTDNTKERNANKLNLSKSATGFAAYLLATGMPEKTAYLYMIQPSMIEFMNLKKGGILGENSTAVTWMENRIQELLDRKIAPKENVTTEDLIKNIKDNGEDESLELAILQDMQKMEKQSETYFKVARVLRLNQGVKGDMENFDTIISDLHDLGLNIEKGTITKMSDKDFGKLDTCIDIRDALLTDHGFMSNILHCINQLDSCMPAMFLQCTTEFRNMTEGAMSSLMAPKSPVELPKFKRDVTYDLLSYIGIRALKYAMENDIDNPLYDKANSLNHELLFGNGETITKRVQDVKDQLKSASAKGITNYLLEYYLVSGEPRMDKQGKVISDIHLLEANTWAKLSEIQQQRLIGAFVDLYQNSYNKTTKYRNAVETNSLAKAMFNYILVKDGGQFANGSFIRMLPPFIFKDIMDKIGLANELMKNEKGSYEKLFGKGVTAESMLTDFLKGYTTHIANKKFVLNLKAKRNHKDIITQREDSEGRSVIINAFGNVRAAGDKITGTLTDSEKETLADNKKTLNELGLKNSGGAISFPMSFHINNTLYTLKEVYRKDKEEGKWKPVVTDTFIQTGEYAPSGLKAKYVETPWTGSKKQFAAACAAGPVPKYTLTIGEKKTKESGDKEMRGAAITEKMQRDYYYKEISEKLEGTVGAGSRIRNVVALKSTKEPLIINGKMFGSFAKAYNALEEQKTIVSSQSMEKPIPKIQVERIPAGGRKVHRVEVNNNPKTLYVYGDNTQRRGYGGAAKEMRPMNGDNSNSFGIASKKLPSLADNAFFTDNELEHNKQVIKEDTDKVVRELMTGKYNKVVIAPIGVAGGMADLERRAPQTFAFLQSQLDRINNFSKEQESTKWTSEQWGTNLENLHKELISNKLTTKSLEEFKESSRKKYTVGRQLGLSDQRIFDKIKENC